MQARHLSQRCLTAWLVVVSLLFSQLALARYVCPSFSAQERMSERMAAGMVRSQGFLRSLDDFRSIPLASTKGTPVLLRDVATVQIGPELRRGIAELDGEGEVASGIVLQRVGMSTRIS